jgi:hypothetical protein
MRKSIKDLAEARRLKKLKRIFLWTYGWKNIPRRRQLKKLKVRRWRSVIDGKLYDDDYNAVQDLMAFKERYKDGQEND